MSGNQKIRYQMLALPASLSIKSPDTASLTGGYSRTRLVGNPKCFHRLEKPLLRGKMSPHLSPYHFAHNETSLGNRFLKPLWAGPTKGPTPTNTSSKMEESTAVRIEFWAPLGSPTLFEGAIHIQRVEDCCYG